MPDREVEGVLLDTVDLTHSPRWQNGRQRERSAVCGEESGVVERGAEGLASALTGSHAALRTESAWRGGGVHAAGSHGGEEEENPKWGKPGQPGLVVAHQC